MYPENIEMFDCTASEKQFYYALKEQLPVRCHVFYSVKWYTEKNGIRQNSESDFLIFDPDFGYITIEVKGGIGIKRNNYNDWILMLDNENYRVLDKSPFMQAEGSMHFFKKYFEDHYKQNFRGVYGFACAFPFYNIPANLSTEAPKELVIDFSNMKDLHKKINSIFHYWKSTRRNVSFLPQDTINKFVTLINKQISISVISGATLELQHKKIDELNTIQNNYLDLTENFNQAFFVGGAGTGKTWIALKKAIRDANSGKDVLFLCFNSELAIFLVNETKHYENITCKTFWQLGKENIKDFDRLTKDKELFGILAAFTDVPSLPKFHTVIVDEAQDFNEEWALSTRLFLRNDKLSNLYIFYDSEQNIFNRNFKNGFLIDSPPFLLRENLRNTSAIINWVKNNTSLGNYTKTNNIPGVKPEKHLFRKKKDVRNRLEVLLKQLIQKELVNSKSIVILSDRKIENSILNGSNELGPFKITESHNCCLSDNEILFKTVQSFKGLESDIVIYLKHIDSKLLNRTSLDFVAYTRAKFLLYVLEIKE
ncbi:NERD domain-containing protein [Fictibacillus sp. FJAT-27399]|uniref:NERD domain-containing protein n=1 Tax=Fictibacillus sp. FJAT-27399 TaxID=1729689 RepID=UPI001F345F47|nr:NERD domain-containing protein [Fictibacillus sp. FJAT-27399]